MQLLRGPRMEPFMTTTSIQPPPPPSAVGDGGNSSKPSLHNGSPGVAPFSSIGGNAVQAPSAEAAQHHSRPDYQSANGRQPDHQSVADADGSRHVEEQDKDSELSFSACLTDA